MRGYIITFQEPWFQWQEDYRELFSKEYNTDTSAEHFNRNEDIVRAIDIDETIETGDKEPL